MKLKDVVRVLRQELTEEEVKERYATLAKMRAYALYEERKRHQMNKIKSKVMRGGTYSRISEQRCIFSFSKALYHVYSTGSASAW